ncbi:hypothetical protein [Bradyrhizobium liaoningense]
MGYFTGIREAGKNVTEVGCENWINFRQRIISDLFADGLFRKGRYLFRVRGLESQHDLRPMVQGRSRPEEQAG